MMASSPNPASCSPNKNEKVKDATAPQSPDQSKLSKTAATPPNNASTLSGSSPKEVPSPDVKNRGWPKGKKRYPKSPGAPKQPLSGYVHFLNDRRESVRKESPDISFADISKKLANEWSQLGPAEKQKYVERAELDKERYSREFADYQQTAAYKEFVSAQQKEPNSHPPASKKSKKSKDNSSKMEDVKVKQEELLPFTEVPIFREEFLELNKAREAELRQLRRQATEFEEQNAILQKHVDNMRSAVGKLERETAQTKENNVSLEKQLDAVRRVVMKHFGQIPLPKGEPLSTDNVDAYVQQLQQLVVENPNENPSLVSRVKEVTANLDLSSLEFSK